MDWLADWLPHRCHLSRIWTLNWAHIPTHNITYRKGISFTKEKIAWLFKDFAWHPSARLPRKRLAPTSKRGGGRLPPALVSDAMACCFKISGKHPVVRNLRYPSQKPLLPNRLTISVPIRPASGFSVAGSTRIFLLR